MPYRFARPVPPSAALRAGLPKFSVGQKVGFAAAPLNPKAEAPTSFTVIRVLPMEGARRSYRIKGDTETFERVAEEVQLAELN